MTAQDALVAFRLRDIPMSPRVTKMAVEGSGTKTIPAAIGSNPVGNKVRLLSEPPE